MCFSCFESRTGCHFLKIKAILGEEQGHTFGVHAAHPYHKIWGVHPHRGIDYCIFEKNILLVLLNLCFMHFGRIWVILFMPGSKTDNIFNLLILFSSPLFLLLIYNGTGFIAASCA